MTLASTTTKVQYDGDGSTTSFPVTFKFLSNSHVEVILTDANGSETTWVEGTQYTLTGAGQDAGGTLTTKAGYTVAATDRLTFVRAAPETQLSDLVEGGRFSSDTVETALDYLTMLVQAHSEELSRAIVFAEGSTWDGEDVTLPDPEANTILGWNSGGTDLENYSLTSIGDTLDTLFSSQAAGDYLRALDATTWENRSKEETQADLDIVLMSQVFGG